MYADIIALSASNIDGSAEANRSLSSLGYRLTEIMDLFKKTPYEETEDFHMNHPKLMNGASDHIKSLFSQYATDKKLPASIKYTFIMKNGIVWTLQVNAKASKTRRGYGFTFLTYCPQSYRNTGNVFGKGALSPTNTFKHVVQELLYVIGCADVEVHEYEKVRARPKKGRNFTLTYDRNMPYGYQHFAEAMKALTEADEDLIEPSFWEKNLWLCDFVCTAGRSFEMYVYEQDGNLSLMPIDGSHPAYNNMYRIVSSDGAIRSQRLHYSGNGGEGSRSVWVDSKVFTHRPNASRENFLKILCVLTSIRGTHTATMNADLTESDLSRTWPVRTVLSMDMDLDALTQKMSDEYGADNVIFRHVSEYTDSRESTERTFVEAVFGINPNR